MMDEIRITGLRVRANHGMRPEETKLGQDFYVDAVLYAPTRMAGMSDDSRYTTDYGEVCQFITTFLQENTRQLIEAAAEETARAVLLNFPAVRELQFTLHKPQAPIGLPFDDVSVTIRRKWHKAYIALGSNMGNREGYLSTAVSVLQNHPDIKLGKVSSLMETKPYGGVEQPDFLNGALEISTLLPPMELLNLLRSVEDAAGRERTVHWGPRTLDLDILFFDDMVINSEALTVPHPDLQNRTFVLEPLAQIAPYLMHPRLHRTVRELLTDLQSKE